MTIAIAAINTDREYICIEKNPNIFRIGQQRVGRYLKFKEID